MSNSDFNIQVMLVYGCIQSLNVKFATADIMAKTKLTGEDVIRAVKYLQSKGKIQLEDAVYWENNGVIGWSLVNPDTEPTEDQLHQKRIDTVELVINDLDGEAFSIDDIVTRTAFNTEHVIDVIKELQTRNIIEYYHPGSYLDISHFKGWSLQEKEK